MEKTNINTELIEEAVYKLCVEANTLYGRDLYEKLVQKSKADNKVKESLILKNIKIAAKTRRPLCQDTGQVLVFVKMGYKVSFTGKNIDSAINDAVSNCYKENYYRKSVVKNAIFDRENTSSNTPAIIYYEFYEGERVEINVLIKGAGAENYSKINMFKPSYAKEELFEFVKETVKNAGEKACPPLVLGIGIGGTMDSAALLSKKAFFEKVDEEETGLAQEIKESLDDNSILDVRVKTSATHIASLPMAVTINCHCTRHACAVVEENGITYRKEKIDYKNGPVETEAPGIKIDTSDIEGLRSLKPGTEILLSGEIYTARDAAHQKIVEIFENEGKMPFDIKDKIIFYAGPCPNTPDEIIGPIGPTTAARMDKFTEFMYSNGLLATIGKGERSNEACESIKKHSGKYFTAIGGISCLLAQTVKKAEIIAFEELGAEAVYKLYVENLPMNTNV